MFEIWVLQAGEVALIRSTSSAFALLRKSEFIHRFVAKAMSMEMERLFHMNDGLGDSSYAQNSTLLQKRALDLAEPILKKTVLSMKTMMETNTFCIAELGCSSGPNALLAAENITKTLKAKNLSAGVSVPQFQVFFNDLPASDFNSLFRVLPPSVMTDHQTEDGVAASGNRSYFAAGVPGSFYGRLFPDKTLHFVHSSFSLHWLSKQVPPEILEKNSVTSDKGKIFCGGSRAVGKAYFHQYQKDFNAFLRARAEEMVGGGRMLLLLLGRAPREPTDQGFMAFSWELLESSLNDLVSEGLIEEEKLDSFNLPLFCPCREEVSSEVAREASFEIQRLDILIKPDSEEKVNAMRGSASAKEAYGKKIAKEVRAVTESLLEYHFGEEIIDLLFHRYGELFARRWSEPMKYPENGEDLVIVLERK